MQNKSTQRTRQKKVSRVYSSRPRRSRSQDQVENSEKDSQHNDTCNKASSGNNIDLPTRSVDAAVTSLPQSFSFDPEVGASGTPENDLNKTEENLSSVFNLCNAEFALREDPRYVTLSENSKNATTQTFLETVQLLAEGKNETESREIVSKNNFAPSSSRKIPQKAAEFQDHSNSGSEPATDPLQIQISGKNRKIVSSSDNVTHYVQRGSVQAGSVRNVDKLKRPQYQVSGFMEDHAEFASDWREATQRQGGRYTPSVLESTVDGSVVKGARRPYGSRVTPTELDSFIDMAIQIGSDEKDPLISLDEWGLKTEQHKYKCSACKTVSKTRLDIEQHIADMQKDHEKAVVVVLIGPEARGRSCPLCNEIFQRTHLFKHIRESHNTFFPLRCGYCVFMGQDHNQLRHHIRKKHGTSKYRIIDVSLILAESGELGEKSLLEDEDQSDEDIREDSAPQGNMLCPLCGKGLKNLRNLKKHVAQHSRQKQQCMLCPFTTTFPTQVRSHFRRKHPTHSPKWQKVTLEKGGSDALVEDVGPYLRLITRKYGVRQPKKEKKWMRQYRCPHCDYICSFNSSYNRHLRLHKGVKPYKCGYCDFHGREAYVVRKHCSKVHKGKEVLVENDKNFKAPYRFESRTKIENYEWISCPGNEGLKNNVNQENESCQLSKGSDKEPAEARTLSTSAMTAQAPVECSDEKVLIAGSSASFAQKFECLTFKTLSVMAEDQVVNNLHVQQDQSGPLVTQGLEPNSKRSANLRRQMEKVVTDTLECEESSSKKDLNYEVAAITNPSLQPNSAESSNPELCNLRPNFELQPENQSVKVKTFKVKHTPQSKCVNVNEIWTDAKKLPSTVLESEISNTNVDRVETSLDSMKCEPSFCSISSVSLDCEDGSDKTFVIELSATDNEGFTVKEVPGFKKLEKLSHKNSEEPVSLYVDTKRVNKTHQSLPVQSENKAVASSLSKDFSITEPTTSKKNVNKLITAEATKSGNSEANPSNGLESTLHTHIAFLTDSLVQRLSSPISATPGVMTRDLLGLDYSNSDYFSSEKVRLMMKKKSGGRVKCNVCGVTTTYRAFYKHAKKHFHIKPFKCGYCSYRSIEKSRIRVHNTFCHPNRPCIILKLSPETAGITAGGTHQTSIKMGQPDPGRPPNRTNKVDDETFTTFPDAGGSVRDSNNTNICNKILPSNSNSCESQVAINKKVADKIVDHHSSSTTSTVVSNVSPGPSTFHCPICYKQLQIHTPSIRRHLYSHYGYKPYKCGYCNFTAIGQNEIRAHHVTHGFATVPKVESSGIAMPAGLTSYVNELLGQQRGSRKPQRKRGQVTEHQMLDETSESEREPAETQQEPSDLMWTEMASKEELATIYFTPQEQPQQALVPTPNTQQGIDLPVEAGPLTQPLEPVDLYSEAAYAVQVLESGQNPGPGTSPPPQLDVGGNSYSQFDSDQVCVVYLID
ncbi:uncharacterized protein LOC125031789 [Penaeus chinensis]|uniref:uncharacterized protein LOC125031789 n=1 Tax=Penaeus chinensis TaxID=139456 RepID=UPI001FB6929C|nr:uncharacterized protein LOC125031789 [Penaeus chinensis]XP_047478690.1 uncharacterized protein LOC125031789 [Penaeus chinensis]